MTSKDIFDGIVAVSHFASAIVFALATWVAYVQLSAWQNDRRLQVFAEKSKCYSDFVSALSSYFDHVRSNGDTPCNVRQKYFEEHNRLLVFASTDVLRKSFLHAKANLAHARALHSNEGVSAADLTNLDHESDETQKEMLVAMRNEIFGNSPANSQAIDDLFREYAEEQ